MLLVLAALLCAAPADAPVEDRHAFLVELLTAKRDDRRAGDPWLVAKEGAQVGIGVSYLALSLSRPFPSASPYFQQWPRWALGGAGGLLIAASLRNAILTLYFASTEPPPERLAAVLERAVAPADFRDWVQRERHLSRETRRVREGIALVNVLVSAGLASLNGWLLFRSGGVSFGAGNLSVAFGGSLAWFAIDAYRLLEAQLRPSRVERLATP